VGHLAWPGDGDIRLGGADDEQGGESGEGALHGTVLSGWCVVDDGQPSHTRRYRETAHGCREVIDFGMRRPQIRNPNLEIRNKFKIRNSKPAPGLGHSNFGFVSDFEIRISDLAVEEWRELALEPRDAALHGPDVESEREHLAAESETALGVGAVARQDGPVNAVRFGRLGDALERLPQLRMVPIGQAHGLA